MATLNEILKNLVEISKGDLDVLSGTTQKFEQDVAQDPIPAAPEAPQDGPMPSAPDGVKP
jgi:hypothetical protein